MEIDRRNLFIPENKTVSSYVKSAVQSKKRGKKFEEKLMLSFMNTFPKGTIDRLKDTEGKKKAVKNISDYISYCFPYMYYIEAKTKKNDHNKPVYYIKELRQLDDLKTKIGIFGTVAGILIWFYESNEIIYTTIDGVVAREKRGVPGIRPSDVEIEEFETFRVPFVTPREYPVMELTLLKEIANKKWGETK